MKNIRDIIYSNPEDGIAKQLLRYGCFVLVFAITALSFIAFIFLLQSIFYSSNNEFSNNEIILPIATSTPNTSIIATTTNKKVSGIIPTLITIPTLKIDTKVEKVGINAKGIIASPLSFQTVGWYMFGPRPGDPGVAIMDGHVDNGLGLSGIFTNLNKIKIGSDIYIYGKDKKKLHFIVVSTSTVDYTSRLNDIIYNENPNVPELVLISCVGDWLPKQKTYKERIIVYARLVE